MAGIAKKAYDWAQRPENQAKIKQGVERVKQRAGQGKGGPSHKAGGGQTPQG